MADQDRYERNKAWHRKWDGHQMEMPGLGELRFTEDVGTWHATKFVPLLDREFLISFHSPSVTGEWESGGPPGPLHPDIPAVWGQFCDLWPSTRWGECLETMHKFLLQLVDEYGGVDEMIGYDDDPELVEKIVQSKDAMEQNLELIHVTVGFELEQPEIMIDFECSAEIEHGISLRFFGPDLEMFSDLCG